MGPVANRISNAQFELEAQVYSLDKNEGVHHLHGGAHGFSHKLWTCEVAEQDRLVFSYLREDGEGGYSGKVKCTHEIVLISENAIKTNRIRRKATRFGSTFLHDAGFGCHNFQFTYIH